MGVACLGERTASAEVAAAQSSPPVAAVERLQIHLVGRARDADLRRLLEEWLAPLGLAIALVEQPTLDADQVLAADADSGRVRVWLTLNQQGSARLYFAEPNARRFLLRDVPLESGLDELGREQIAQVLLSAAQAFLEQRADTPVESLRRAFDEPSQGSPAPVERAPTKVPPTAPLPPRARFHWAVGARYALAFKGDAGVAHGPGATIEAGIERSQWRLALAVEGRYELPYTVEGDDLRLSFSTLGVQGALQAAWIRAHDHVWILELGGGIDRVAVSPSSRPGSAAVARSPSSDIAEMLHVSVGRAWYVANVRLSLGLRVDLALESTHYDLNVDGIPVRELTPWRAAPGGFLAAGWN